MKTEFISINELLITKNDNKASQLTNFFINHLSKCELVRYLNALEKIRMEETLNKKDLNLLNKIDAITFKYFGFCLKDSLITESRLQACKKYGVEFNDRDGLVEHMKHVCSYEL